MEENSTRMTQVYFSISLAFLIEKYINITLLKYYRKYNEDKIMKYELWAIDDILKKYENISEEQATEKLDAYFSRVLKHTVEVILTPGLMYDFCEWEIENYMKTLEYKENLKKYKLKYDLDTLESYAYDKNTGKIVECEFGEHAIGINELCNDYLIKKYNLKLYDAIPEEYYDELDKYITDNIVLKGAYHDNNSNRYKSYKVVNPTKIISKN